MSRWADSTDDEDDYSQDEDHEDYIDHAIEADQITKTIPSSAYNVHLPEQNMTEEDDGHHAEDEEEESEEEEEEEEETEEEKLERQKRLDEARQVAKDKKELG